MKKLIAILLCCLLVSTPFASVVHASTDTSPATEKTISYSVNEYELLEALSTKSNNALRQMGYSNTEINQMKNLRSSYADHLQVISHYSKEALENLGYTESQIDILQKFNGTENQIRSLAATLDINLTIDYVTWSDADNRTNSRVYFDFEWSGIPLVKANDLIAVSWNNWTINGKTCYITYYPMNGTDDAQIKSATYVPNSGPTAMGGGFKFPMLINNGSDWAKSGYCIFTLYRNYIREDLSAYAAYIHYTMSVSPTLTMPGFGSIDLQFGSAISGEVWADKTCSN